MLTRIFVRDMINLSEGGIDMEFLKCKSVIVLVVMILGVSYIGAGENVAVQNCVQDNDVEVTEKA